MDYLKDRRILHYNEARERMALSDPAHQFNMRRVGHPLDALKTLAALGALCIGLGVIYAIIELLCP